MKNAMFGDWPGSKKFINTAFMCTFKRHQWIFITIPILKVEKKVNVFI